MRANDKCLVEYSLSQPDFEGRLNYKKIVNGASYSQKGFKERWFKLKANLLFYFKINELGQIEKQGFSDREVVETYNGNMLTKNLQLNLKKKAESTKKPSGLFVLENSRVQQESSAGLPFAFSISFRDDLERKHILSAGTEDHVCQWIMFLRQAAYEHWRSQLIVLQTKICQLTGNDPLLMYPRNHGSVRNITSKREVPLETFKTHVTLQEPPVQVANLIDL